MAVRYYDDSIIQKLRAWVPESSNLRVLKPDESKRLFEITANDKNDRPIQLPFIALSRNNDISILSNVKQLRSFSGAKINNNTYDSHGKLIVDSNEATLHLNAIPISVQYQLDIYTKTYEEGDEYLRNFLFKLINNPVITIEIPYNGQKFEHIANIRVLDSVSDTSDIGERLFSGQFTRWSIQMEIQDAFLFSIPYRKNWKINGVEIATIENITETPKEENIEKVYDFNKDA